MRSLWCWGEIERKCVCRTKTGRNISLRTICSLLSFYMNISILIPSRNGLEFLQWSYHSIRKNQGNHNVELLILDDFSDKDDTWKWLQDQSILDANLQIFRNEGPERWGISGGFINS